MINIVDLLKQKENNQLEVKEAINGLPNSIWETYSSFANSYGGTILLGVSENENKDLIPCGLTELAANNLIKTFWDTIHSNRVSINILTDKHVRLEKIDKSYVVVIHIPQASRFDKPICLNNNVYLSYRRNHEGDYKCSKKEVINMIRDSDINSADSYIVDNLTIDVLCKETIEKYRIHFTNNKGKEHPFSNEPLDLFLRHIGAAKFDDNNILRPTKAGLLMFGYNYDIITVYPNFFLDYQDKRNIFGEMRWVNRIYSSSGDWSGNLFDFFFRINNYLVEDIKTPFKLNGIFRVDITPMHKSIREVLCNCLSNADYNETRGLVIKQYSEKLEFSNPGSFAIQKDLAYSGGNSDARNKSIISMFNNINIGERTGSGIPLILKSAKEVGFPSPTFQDFFNPDYTLVTIYINNLDIQNNNLDIQGNNLDIQNNNLDIPNFLNDLPIRIDLKERLRQIYNNIKSQTFSSSDIVEILNCRRSSAQNYIKILLSYKLIEPIIGKGKGKYKFIEK